MKIPIFDIYGFGCGIYLGYAHNNGINVSDSFYALSPGIFSVTATYSSLKFIEFTYSKIKNEKLEDLNLKDKNDKKIIYENFSLEEKIEFGNKFNSSMDKIENKLSKINKTKSTINSTVKTSISTYFGYLIGRILFS